MSIANALLLNLQCIKNEKTNIHTKTKQQPKDKRNRVTYCRFHL